MVSGAGVALTAGACVSQWADITRIAAGRGNSVASCLQARVSLLSSRAIVGAPCDRNTTGIFIGGDWCRKPLISSHRRPLGSSRAALEEFIYRHLALVGAGDLGAAAALIDRAQDHQRGDEESPGEEDRETVIALRKPRDRSA